MPNGVERFTSKNEETANKLFNFSREAGSRALRFITEDAQDDILHPENYIDNTTTSGFLNFNTPIGDRYVVLRDNNINRFIIENPIITVDRNREIIETKVQGLDSSIFEIVDNCSYKINIVGILAGDSVWKYDFDGIKDLNKISSIKTYLNINNPYLNDLFKVKTVVLNDHKINQSSEYTNITAIEINLTSVLIDDQNSIFKPKIN